MILICVHDKTWSETQNFSKKHLERWIEGPHIISDAAPSDTSQTTKSC